jgi:hypothetical protein
MDFIAGVSKNKDFSKARNGTKRDSFLLLEGQQHLIRVATKRFRRNEEC